MLLILMFLYNGKVSYTDPVGYQNFRSLDRFVQPQFPVAKLPTVNSATTDSNKPFPTNDGGELPGVIQ